MSEERSTAVEIFLKQCSRDEKLAILFLKHVCCYREFKVELQSSVPSLKYSLILKNSQYQSVSFATIYSNFCCDWMWIWKESLNSGIQIWIAPFVEGTWMLRFKKKNKGEESQLFANSQVTGMMQSALNHLDIIEKSDQAFDFVLG
jgi:hypothetical protein